MTGEPTHDVIITTSADDQVAIAVSRPDKPGALDLAQEYAQRVRGDAALWGMVHDGCAVVVPARSVAHVEIVERQAAHTPTHAVAEETAGPTSAPDAPPFDPDPPAGVVPVDGPATPATPVPDQESAPAA